MKKGHYKDGIHKTMHEQMQLAETYAQDGAFHSAARVLSDLAQKVHEHALWCDEMTKQMIAQHNRKGKSRAKSV